MRLVSDIETNGLLHQLSKFHCAVAIDVDTEEVHRFGPTEIDAYIKLLETADEIIFHNGIGFDHPALKLLYPDADLPCAKILDTLVLSRLIFSDMKNIDFRKNKQSGSDYKLPGRLIGSHALAAWGYRLHDYKGDFKPQDYLNAEGEPHTWLTIPYSQDMMDYCEQDVWVTLKLLRLLERKEYSPEAITLEHGVAWLMAQQERNGWKVDRKRLIELYANLSARREVIRAELTETFGWWYGGNGETNPKRTITYKDKSRAGLIQGAPYTKLKEVHFNPGSRLHIARCLEKRYGWQPKEFTPSGQPQIDEDILGHLRYAEADALIEYFIINKLIGMVAEGNNAWLRLIKDDDYIHHRVNPNGAGTGRATHAKPNLAQVPGNRKPFGEECRGAFTVPTGWCLLGTDASGLELRCLGNALYPYDDGAYIDVILNGDIHWANVLALALVPPGTVRDEHNTQHEAARNIAKTFIYAFLYGAGNELLGEAAGYTSEDEARWKAAAAIANANGKKTKGQIIVQRATYSGRKLTRQAIMHTMKGEELRGAFLKNIPALKRFQEDMKACHSKDGHIVGFDGRRITTRSAHSATNFRLQGDGALICKLWGVYLEQACQDAGLQHGRDGDYFFVGWIHDEYQIACRTEEIAEQIGMFAKEAIKAVGKHWDIDCPLDADFKIGPNWAATH